MSTLQQPTASGFGAASTAAKIIAHIDLDGRLAIVTGGYSGIGLETARQLASAGARVVVPARDQRKAAEAVTGVDGIELASLDLMDAASIARFADQMLDRGAPIDLLINNAGIMATPLIRDARGYEAQFATNHLGHFQLTTSLWPALAKAQGARVVTLSSRGHFFSPVDLDDPNFELRDYDRWCAYGQSKTANILFSVALDARGASEGIHAFAAHPGTVVETELKRSISETDLKATGAIDENGWPILDPARNKKTIAQGAATTIWCAVSPQLDGLGGVYCENCDISRPVPDEIVQSAQGALSRPDGVMPYATDADAAEALWRLSETLIAR